MTNEKVACLHAEQMPDVGTQNSQLAQKGGNAKCTCASLSNTLPTEPCEVCQPLDYSEDLPRMAQLQRLKTCQHALEITS